MPSVKPKGKNAFSEEAHQTPLIQINGEDCINRRSSNNSSYTQHHLKESKPLRFLIVEDNHGDYLLFKNKLSRSGIYFGDIIRAQRLSEVETILKDQEVDMAFLDLSLPDSSGIDSFVSLNNLLPHTPIIVLSGLSDMDVALETISIGAQDFLMKGEFDEKLLAKSISYSLERKKTLEKLKESNERFEYVTQATFDAVWDCNLHTKELYWADNFQTIFGHTPAKEVDNFNLWPDLLHPEDKEKVLKRLEEVLERGDKNWVEEYRFKKADGQYAFISDKAIVLHDNSGKACRMIGAMQDITRQKQDTKAIEEQNIKLKEIAWMQSHEVRAPLARIMGLINCIDDFEDMKMTRDELLGHIKSSAHELDGIIREIVTKASQIE